MKYYDKFLEGSKEIWKEFAVGGPHRLRKKKVV